MDWILILVISLVPSVFSSSLASIFNPDGDTTRQINECLPPPSSKELVELPSLGPLSNPNALSAALAIPQPQEPAPTPQSDDTSSAILHHYASSASPNGKVTPPITDAAAAQNHFPLRDLPTRGSTLPLPLLFTIHSNSQQSQFILGDRTDTNYASINIELPSAQSFAHVGGNSRTQYPIIEFPQQSQFIIGDRTDTNYASINIELPSAQSFAHVGGNSRTQYPIIEFPQTRSSSSSSTTSHNSTAGHNHEMMMPRDQSFKLGKTLLGITFQAVISLMIFRFQGSQSSSSSSNNYNSSSPSISFDIVGAAMLIGFTSTLIGIVLRSASAYPTAASIGEYTGIISSAFGFLMTTEMFLPESFNWTVWPAGAALFLALIVLALAKLRHNQFF